MLRSEIKWTNEPPIVDTVHDSRPVWRIGRNHRGSVEATKGSNQAITGCMVDEEMSLNDAASHSAVLRYQTSSAEIYAARTFVIIDSMLTAHQHVSDIPARTKCPNQTLHKNTAIPSIRFVMPTASLTQWVIF